jgi:hypothetical protein
MLPWLNGKISQFKELIMILHLHSTVYIDSSSLSTCSKCGLYICTLLSPLTLIDGNSLLNVNLLEM